MTFADLLGAIRRNRLAAGLAFVLCLFVGGAAAILPDTRYRSTATLFIQPQEGQAGDAFGAVETARFVLPALAELVGTTSFRTAVRNAVPPADRGAGVPTLAATPEAGTPILRVSAEGTVPRLAEVWANEAARLLIERNPSPLVTIAVIDAARLPTSPSGPLRVPIFLGSLVLGTIAALFAALAANALRRRVTGPEEIRQRFGIEVLGEIPATRRFPARAADTFGPDADPLLQDAYQRLRTNLDLILMSRRLEGVAVTSFALGEGKTSVAAHLGWAMARLGQHVILVDADVRRPALHAALGVSNERGLVQARDVADPKTLLRDTEVAGLSVVASGGVADNPLDVISNVLPRFLGKLEGFGRLVIVDTPPLVVAESSLIAAFTKAVVLVVDVQARTVDDVAKTLDELRLVGTDVIGVVLNRTRRRRKGSSYYYYQRRPPRRAAPRPSRRRATTDADG